ncbi:MAG TPA: MBL fold metallo-hydrolase [Gemmataceae bacterium]|nr:MBL fold metallo-hydrolase [Gemmataceae bacterium]
MKRLIAALAASLLVATAAAAADSAAKVTIRWHGQSFFELESSKGTHVVFDPHLIDAYGRTEVPADLILVSHEHNDHNQIEAVKNYMKVKTLHGLRQNGNRLDWNPIDETFRDIHVRSLGVYHDNVKGMQYGKNTIFILEVGGLRIVHLGDLGHLLSDKMVKEIGDVDVLMIPVGGIYTINGSEAKKVVAQLKPRQYILPMHYGTKVFDDVLPPDEFLDEQKNFKKLPTNTLEIKTDFKPAEPVIVLLDWK